MQNPPPPPPPGYPPPPQMPPPPGYPPAGLATQANFGGFWIRVVAYIIDGILLGIVGGILLAIFQVNPTSTSNLSSGSYSAARLIDLVISLAYFAGFWTYWGATPGQRILGLRVVDANTQQRIGFGKAAVRWVGLLISFAVCFIGVIWVAFDGRKQGWMDKIAGTVVVRA